MDPAAQSKQRNKWWLQESLTCEGCTKPSRLERSFWNRKRNRCNHCSRCAVAEEKVLESGAAEMNQQCRANGTRRAVAGAFPDNSSEVQLVRAPQCAVAACCRIGCALADC